MAGWLLPGSLRRKVLREPVELARERVDLVFGFVEDMRLARIHHHECLAVEVTKRMVKFLSLAERDANVGATFSGWSGSAGGRPDETAAVFSAAFKSMPGIPKVHSDEEDRGFVSGLIAGKDSGTNDSADDPLPERSAGQHAERLLDCLASLTHESSERAELRWQHGLDLLAHSPG